MLGSSAYTVLKRLRKYLPTHAAIIANRYLGWTAPWLRHHNLWKWHRHSAAGGVAVGMAAGLVPGTHIAKFLAAAVACAGFRVNLPVALVTTLYMNPFTFLPIYLIAYEIGKLILPQSGDASFAAFDPAGRNLSEWLPAFLGWLSAVGKPLIIGVPALAAILAAVGYFAVDWAWQLYVCRAWRKRRRLRASARRS